MSGQEYISGLTASYHAGLVQTAFG